MTKHKLQHHEHAPEANELPIVTKREGVASESWRTLETRTEL